MSLLDRDEVPEPKSLASTKPTDRPRVAASSATPAPTTPPPTTSTWTSLAASTPSAASRSSGPSLAVPPVITSQKLPGSPHHSHAPGPREPKGAAPSGLTSEARREGGALKAPGGGPGEHNPRG